MRVYNATHLSRAHAQIMHYMHVVTIMWQYYLSFQCPQTLSFSLP